MLGRALIPLAMSLAACSAPTVALDARYGEYGVDGSLLIADSGTFSATNDLETLGLGEEEATTSFSGQFKWGAPHLYVSTQESEFSGTGVLEADLVTDFGTITAGSAVDSKMDFGLTSAILTFDIIPGPWELGLGVGVSMISIDAEFQDLTSSEFVETDETLPVPGVALSLGVGLGPIDLQLIASGVTASVEDGEVTYYDADLMGRWDFGRFGGSLLFGWKEADYDIEYDDGTDQVALDMNYSGPYVGLRISF
jgi:hypothetical protein